MPNFVFIGPQQSSEFLFGLQFGACDRLCLCKMTAAAEHVVAVRLVFIH